MQVRPAHVRYLSRSFVLRSGADKRRSLRADQKGKVRSARGPAPELRRFTVGGRDIVDDGMAFFWQCQASRSGRAECGGFRVLDMRAEGRGPCMVDAPGVLEGDHVGSDEVKGETPV